MLQEIGQLLLYRMLHIVMWGLGGLLGKIVLWFEDHGVGHLVLNWHLVFFHILLVLQEIRLAVGDPVGLDLRAALAVVLEPLLRDYGGEDGVRAVVHVALLAYFRLYRVEQRRAALAALPALLVRLEHEQGFQLFADLLVGGGLLGGGVRM